MKIINRFFFVLILFISIDSFLYSQEQSYSDTIKIPVQYRRGGEIPPGYQSYSQKYQGIDLQEEKRRSYPLNNITPGTGIWTELNPKVPRVEYFGIHFINPDTGWAVGAEGSIITTLDGGLSWHTIDSPTSNILLNVSSYNGRIVIATGYDGIIIRSEDAGNSWQQVASGVSGDLWRVQMLNDTLGWICGVGPALLKTTDSGLTWNSVSTDYNTFQYWSLDFYDENIGYIAGGYGNILKTTDGGNSWQHFDISSVMEYSLYTIDVVTPDRVFAGGFSRIAYTTNGGNSWTPVGISGTVNTIAFADSLVGYEGEGEGATWKTTDGGITWQINNWFPLYKKNWIMFVNDTLGYIAGNNLNIQKTTNKGEQWKSCIINDDFKDVFFINKDTGWAVSDFNFYKTTNAGDSWIKQSYPARARSLYFIDGLTGFAGDRDNGKIYKTTNGGDTWYETNTTGINGSIGKIIFLDSLTGFATNDLVLKTTDKGENWTSNFNIPFRYFWGIAPSNDSTIWAVGGDNYPFELYKSTDRGNNWIPIPFEEDQHDIFFINEQVGFMTAFNQLYKTTNGGSSFQLDSTLSWFGTSRIENFLNQSVYIVGDKVFVTTNEGEEWFDYPEVQGQVLEALSLYEVNKGYAVGNTGIILKYFDENIPVELTDFSAAVKGRDVLLNWKTITEKNNLGFNVERLKDNEITKSHIWERIGFSEGNGTTTKTHSYSFTDKNVSPGEYKYRLKQLDLDGSYEYSKEVELNIEILNNFFLEQNYPNPFNPTTRISFSLPTDSKVILKLFDILGREIKTLLNKELQAGYYNIDFNASKYPSGVYIYSLKAQEINGKTFNSSKKMLLIR